MQGVIEFQVFEYTLKVENLANQLKVGKVFSSPDLGRLDCF